MLEWRGFLISTKLSYGVYLVQFAVFHFNIGKVRSSSHFGIIKSVVNIDRRMTPYLRTSNIDFDFFQLNTNELLWIVFASSILTLFFDYPFSNLKKLIFDSKKVSVTEKSQLDLNSNEVIESEKKLQ